MKLTRTFLVGSALVALLASSATAADEKSLTIKMAAQNGSGETGTATLTDTPDGLHVVVALDNAPKDTPQPTHIHVGTCDNLDKAPKYPLSNTVNGAGTSDVKGVHLSDLTSAKFAVNVHKSTDDIGTYVSCGDIK